MKNNDNMTQRPVWLFSMDSDQFWAAPSTTGGLKAYYQQYGSRCRMWIPPDIAVPVVRHYPGRKSMGYFGAVRLRDGRFVYRPRK